jgi:hypothetical protein
MQKFFAFTVLFFGLMFGGGGCFAGELGDAVGALEKIQSMTEVGVNHGDYGRALPDMNVAVKKYIRSSSKNPDAAKLMEGIAGRYLQAKVVWDKELLEIETERIKIRSVDDERGKVILETDLKIRQVKVGEKLSPIWEEANKDLKRLLEMIEKKKLKY